MNGKPRFIEVIGQFNNLALCPAKFKVAYHQHDAKRSMRDIGCVPERRRRSLRDRTHTKLQTSGTIVQTTTRSTICDLDRAALDRARQEVGVRRRA